MLFDDIHQDILTVILCRQELTKMTLFQLLNISFKLQRNKHKRLQKVFVCLKTIEQTKDVARRERYQ